MDKDLDSLRNKPIPGYVHPSESTYQGGAMYRTFDESNAKAKYKKTAHEDPYKTVGEKTVMDTTLCEKCNLKKFICKC